jgi:hypothetical protein
MGDQARAGGGAEEEDRVVYHSELTELRPASAWQCHSAGAGTKGERFYDWARLAKGSVRRSQIEGKTRTACAWRAARGRCGRTGSTGS